MFYLITVSFIWAFSYGLIKSELSTLDPNFVTFCRMLVAFLVFLPFLIIKNKKKFIPRLICIGAIQYGAMYLFVLNSYHYLDAYQVVVFSAMTPFYIILINSFIESEFNLTYFMIAGLSIIGFSVLYNIQTMNTKISWGFFLVQCSDLCFAFGQIAYRKFKQNNCDIQDKDIYGFIFLGGLLTSVFFTSFTNSWNSWHNVTIRQGIILIYLGAVASGLCFFWWNKGVIKLHPVMISVFNNLKLLLATLVSIVCFDEQVNAKMHLNDGLFLMVLALIFAQFYQYRYNTLKKYKLN